MELNRFGFSSITLLSAAQAIGSAAQGGLFIIRKRIYLMTVFLLVLFLMLLGRLAWIQIYRGEEFTAEALAQRTRQIEIEEYPRGQVTDRNLIPLTDTVLITALYAIPEEMKDAGELSPGAINNTARQIAKCINSGNPKGIKDKLSRALTTGKSSVRIASNLTSSETIRLDNSGLTGLVVAPEIKRYPQDGFAVHLLGHVDGGDPVKGLSGIESRYDRLLCENEGLSRLVSMQDARGIAIGGLRMRAPANRQVSPGTVVLTIDKRLQQAVEDVMNAKVEKGAVVIMDIRSKNILAMASRPVYNPYDVATVIENDRNGSLNNRCLMSYPPGSVFKLLVAAAALEEGVVNSNELFECTGEYRFNQEAVIPCWKKGGHGKIRFDQAFAESCNSVFIQTGLRLGRANLTRCVRKVHLNDETIGGYNYGSAGTGVDIDGGEAALGNASIGQQGVMLTPVEICSLVATIANDGIWGMPKIVDYFVDKRGIKQEISDGERVQAMQPGTARILQKLMVKTVKEGTGQNAAPAQTEAAGKTGTGQTGNIGRDNQEILNTWFAGYFPTNQPRWAMVILVEEGRSGAEDAAPVFRGIADRMVKILPIIED